MQKSRDVIIRMSVQDMASKAIDSVSKSMKAMKNVAEKDTSSSSSASSKAKGLNTKAGDSSTNKKASDDEKYYKSLMKIKNEVIALEQKWAKEEKAILDKASTEKKKLQKEAEKRDKESAKQLAKQAKQAQAEANKQAKDALKQEKQMQREAEKQAKEAQRESARQAREAAKQDAKNAKDAAKNTKAQQKAHEDLMNSIKSKALFAWTVVKNVVSFAADAVSTYLAVLKKVYDVMVGIGVKAIGGTFLIFEELTRRIVKNTEEFTKFQISLEGALKSTTQAKAIAEYAQTLAIRTPVQFEQIQDIIKSFALIPATRFKLAGDVDKATSSIREFTDVILGLAAIDPVQGVPGALFATREALAGNFRSLALRFEVLPKVVAQSIGKSLDELRGDPELTLKALKTFTSLFVGPDTIRKLGEMPGVLFANIMESGQKALLKIGQGGVFDYFVTEFKKMSDEIAFYFNDSFDQSGMATKFSVRIISILQNVFNAAKAGVGSLADLILGSDADRTMIERFMQGILRVVDMIEMKLNAIGQFFAKNRDQIQKLGSYASNLASSAGKVIVSAAQSASDFGSRVYGQSEMQGQGIFKQFISTYIAAVKLAGNALISFAKTVVWLNPIMRMLGDLIESIANKFIRTESVVKKEIERLEEKSKASRTISEMYFPLSVLTQQWSLDKLRKELRDIQERTGSKASSEMIKNLDNVSVEWNKLLDEFSTQTIEFVDYMSKEGENLDVSSRGKKFHEMVLASQIKPKAEDVFGYGRSLSIASDALSSLNMQANEFAEGLSGGSYDSVEMEMNKLVEVYKTNVPTALEAMVKGMANTANTLVKNADFLIAESNTSLMVVSDMIKKQEGYLVDLTREKAAPEVLQTQRDFIGKLKDSMNIIATGTSEQLVEFWKKEASSVQDLLETMMRDIKKRIDLIQETSHSYSKLQDVSSDALSTEGEKFEAFIQNQIAMLNFQSDLLDNSNQKMATLAKLGRTQIFSSMLQVSPLGSLQQLMESTSATYGMGKTGIESAGEFSLLGFKQSFELISRARNYFETKGSAEISRFVDNFIGMVDSIQDIPVEGFAQQATNIIRALESDMLVKQMPAAQDVINALKGTTIKDTQTLRKVINDTGEAMTNGWSNWLDTMLEMTMKTLARSEYALSLQSAEAINSLSSGFYGGATTLANRAQTDQYGRSSINRLIDNPFAFQESGMTTAQLKSRVTEYYRSIDSGVMRAAEAERQALRDTITDPEVLAQKLHEVDIAAQDLSMTLEDDLANALRNLPLDNVTQSLVSFSDQVGSSIKSGISDSLVSAMNGFNDLGDVGVAVLQNLQKAVADFATQMAFGDIGNLGGMLAGRTPTNLGLFGNLFGGMFGFASGGVVGRPTIGLIGEGAHPEAVVPMPGGRIPLTVSNGNVYVSMPGRNVPTSIKAMADGALIGTPSYGSVVSGSNKDKEPVINVIVVDSEEKIRRDFPGMVENAVIANIRRKGRIHQAMRSNLR